jgi:hypothetical protein
MAAFRCGLVPATRSLFLRRMMGKSHPCDKRCSQGYLQARHEAPPVGSNSMRAMAARGIFNSA